MVESPAPAPDAPLALPGTTGAAVLLIHGFTASPISMRPWAEALAGAGHAVSLPLLPGHGTSWQDLATRRAEEWTSAVEDAYDALAAEHDLVAVAGLSMGGTLALHLAAVRRPCATFLVNPALVPHPFTARLTPWLKHLVETTSAIGGDISRQGPDEGAYSRVPLAAVQQLVRLERQVRAELPGVAGPVTLFRSDVDHVVSEASAVAVERGLRPGVLRARVPLHESLHVATLDHDAELIHETSLAVLEDLLADVAPVRRTGRGRHRATEEQNT